MSLKMQNLKINVRMVPAACIEKVIQLLEFAEDDVDEHMNAAAVSLYLTCLLKKDDLFVDESLVKP